MDASAIKKCWTGSLPTETNPDEGAGQENSDSQLSCGEFAAKKAKEFIQSPLTTSFTRSYVDERDSLGSWHSTTELRPRIKDNRESSL